MMYSALPQFGVPQLPPFMKRLDVLCPPNHLHFLPVRMEFRFEGMSHKGHPVAHYSCTFPGCKCQQVWGRDLVTGRPKPLTPPKPLHR